MEKKSIAFVTPDLKSGGSERVASRLTHLFGDRYKMYYIVFDDDDISYDISAELINLNAPPSSKKITKVVNTFKRAKGIRRAVNEHGIDTVMSFTSIANRALRFSRAKCKKIGACRGFEDLMLHPENYHKTIAAGARMLFNSRESQEYYLSLYPDDADKCLTIENLFDIENIGQMAKEELPAEHRAFFDSHKVVSTVGILSAHKGHWDLLKSFEILRERVPNAGLCIVGHRGALERQIIDMAKRSRYADDILLAGYQSNPFKYVARSGVYALSSISEGFPNALIEAMICGIPCVSTACRTGPCEIMFNEYSRPEPRDEYIVADNGILTPAFDGSVDFNYANKTSVHSIYADALERILTDGELASALAESGRRRAERDNETAVAQQYFDLIEDVK